MIVLAYFNGREVRCLRYPVAVIGLELRVQPVPSIRPLVFLQKTGKADGNGMPVSQKTLVRREAVWFPIFVFKLRGLSFERLSHFFSSLKERVMARKFGFLFLGMCLVMGTLGLVGCDTGGDEDEGTSLVGYWKSEYEDGFEISGDTYTQYDDADKAISFAGTIVNHSDFSAKNGSITIKITKAGTWYKTVDHYLVVLWKDLSGNGVRQSCPYKASDTDPDKATQAEAESIYIEANDYFGMFGAYSKQ
jgi:hypothetical protein